MLVRPKYLTDIQNQLTLAEASWIYSMWPGYLQKDKTFDDLRTYMQEKCVRTEILHTSGHAGLPDLIKLVDAVNPKMVVPIHSNHPELLQAHITNVKLANDGELISV